MTSRSKITSGHVASAASQVLRNSQFSKSSKSAAGSALSQRNTPSKQTSSAEASAASKVLRDGRTSKASKSAAESALS